MLYQYVATLTFARKRNPKVSIVLATGTHDMLVSEKKRWRKVAQVWASQAAKGAKVKPCLSMELVEL